MKYIRTKDGIYEVVKEDDEWLEIISNFERKMQCHCVIKKHAVIKQADTIEELCDEFVFAGLNNKRTFISQYYSIKEIFEIWQRPCNKSFYEIYGAIWTDKGLIYVAKMNDKGELELL